MLEFQSPVLPGTDVEEDSIPVFQNQDKHLRGQKCLSRCCSAGKTISCVHHHVVILGFDVHAGSRFLVLVLPDIGNTAKDGSISYPRPEVVLAEYVQELSVRLQFTDLDKVVLWREVSQPGT